MKLPAGMKQKVIADWRTAEGKETSKVAPPLICDRPSRTEQTHTVASDKLLQRTKKGFMTANLVRKPNKMQRVGAAFGTLGRGFGESFSKCR